MSTLWWRDHDEATLLNFLVRLEEKAGLKRFCVGEWPYIAEQAWAIEKGLA